MSRVLLAMEGIKSYNNFLDYSLDLCKTMRSELQILQIFSPSHLSYYLKGFRNGLRNLQNYLGHSFVASALAEGGDYESAREIMAQLLSSAEKQFQRIIPEIEKKKVHYRVERQIGEPDEVILDYVRRYPEISLALFDGLETVDRRIKRHYSRMFGHLKREIGIPLVIRENWQSK